VIRDLQSPIRNPKSKESAAMKIRTLLLSIASLIFWVVTSVAQVDTTYLTLQDCIRLARANGPLGVIARNTYDSRQSGYRSFSATYLPQLSLQGDVPGFYRSITPIILPDGSTVFTPQSQASSSLSLAITQKIPLTGGQLSVLSGLNRIDLVDSKSQYYKSSPLMMMLTQPLFKINTMSWDQDAQEIRYKMSTRELAEAMEDCAIDVTNKFFDLYLASMSSSNAALNLAINDTLYKISKGRFNVGKIAENDLLQSELAYLNAQTQLENANVGLNRSQQNLRVALGLASSTYLVLIPPTDIPVVSVDPEAALGQARQNRSDMLNFDLQRLTADRNVRQAKSDNYFSATMTASMGYNQRAPILNDAYNNLLDQQQFSLSFNVPIFRWGAGSSAVDAAVADQKRVEASVEQQRHDFDQEVLYQVARLNLLRKQVAVAAKSDTIAQRRFDVAKDRYLIGKIDIPNLFLAQSEKDNAHRANFQTLSDYWSAYFRVRRLTLHDFETGESLVVEKEN
jgi:outer membrane protein TolC